MNLIENNFAINVFNENKMKTMLDEKTFLKFQKCRNDNIQIDKESAIVIAKVIKKWAISRGCTHYTHWFQPLNEKTCEKHDSFIKINTNNINSENNFIVDFSYSDLVKGESDASSLPNGGLRSTETAKGYTAWDYSADVFIIDKVLYIPAVFYSFFGESLDKKIPLLRSNDALNKYAKQLLELCGQKNDEQIVSVVGAEQEYFLIDRKNYQMRPDLIFCGRTLFGSHELNKKQYNHYLGSINKNVLEFMEEVDLELWKVGIPIKTRHNEVSENQFELAPIFENTNIANDHNQIIMLILDKVAKKHNLKCLFHEKPFDGLNGSGKHINWSIMTKSGENFLDPHNKFFILFFACVISAVDEFQDLLRASISYYGNDLRLGGNEAPPAIISIFIGDSLEKTLAKYLDKNNTKTFYEIFNDFENDFRKKHNDDLANNILPNLSNCIVHFDHDSTDRNRTSPFAFCKNKFEFRMPGASMSIADPIIIINTIVSYEMKKMCEKLKEFTKNTETNINKLENISKKIIEKHARIIFNENNYSPQWKNEAKKRDLKNFKNTIEALDCLKSEKNIELFSTQQVLCKKELFARYNIQMENFCKSIHIEADTLILMLNKEILPNSIKYLDELIKYRNTLKEANLETYNYTNKLIVSISSAIYFITNQINVLTNFLKEYEKKSITKDQALLWYNNVLKIINDIRPSINLLENNISKEHWKLPTYYDLLFEL